MNSFEYPGPYMYVSTVSSIVYDNQFEIKIEPGVYKVHVHNEGYVFAKADRVPGLNQAVKILNERDEDPGFYGTYWSGRTDNIHILNIVNKYFVPHFTNKFLEWISRNDEESDEYWSDVSEDDDNGYTSGDGTEVPYVKKLKSLDDYNNIPVMFYLNRKLKITDLKHMHLTRLCVVANIITWNVNHTIFGQLGVAIQQPKFHNMMGDQMGLMMFADKETYKRNPNLKSFGAIGFGNFYVDYNTPPEYDDLFLPIHHSEYYFALTGRISRYRNYRQNLENNYICDDWS